MPERREKLRPSHAPSSLRSAAESGLGSRLGKRSGLRHQFYNPFHDIGDGDGISHAFHIRGGELGRIDPDEFPIQIQQRTAAVSGIDGRIGLNIGGRCTVFIGNAAIERADNPGGYRLAIACVV